MMVLDEKFHLVVRKSCERF